MVTEDKVILDLDNTFFSLRVVFFYKEKKLCLYCGLIVILLLVFHKLHRNKLLGLVVNTL